MNHAQQKLFIWIGGGLMMGILALTLLSPPPNEEDQKWTALDSVERQELTRLTLQSPELTYTLDISQSPLKWQDHSTPLQSDKVEQLITELIELSCSNPLNGPREEYGLASPQWILSLEGPQTSRQVKVGHKSALSSHHYVDCDTLGGPRLSRYALSLPAQFEDFIDGSLMDINPQSIDKVTLSDNQMLQRIEGEWQLIHPLNVRLDSERVQAWLESLNALQGETWLEDFEANNALEISFEHEGKTQSLTFDDGHVQSTLGDWFKVSDDDYKSFELDVSSFYSTELLERNDPPLSIHLQLKDKAYKALYDDDWDDSGKLWAGLQEITVRRAHDHFEDEIGMLTLQYTDAEIKRWAIGEGETDYVLKDSSESTALHIPKSVLDGVLVRTQE